MRAEPCGTERAALGESPVWDAALERLLWVDLDGGRVHAWDARTGADAEILECDDAVGAVCLRREGGLVIAAGGSVLTAGDGVLRPLSRPVDDDALRFNDAACDPQGRLWGGSCAREPGTRPGALYAMEPDGRHRVVRCDLEHPNGLDWSPDGERFYLVDSRARILWSHPFDPVEGMLGPGQEVRRFRPEDGLPDGLCIDADGRLWLAFWGGGAVWCMAPNGTIEEMVTVDTPLATSCAFGGPGLDQLYITTARGDDADGPDAGLLHVVEPGVRGRHPHAFAG